MRTLPIWPDHWILTSHPGVFTMLMVTDLALGSQRPPAANLAADGTRAGRLPFHDRRHAPRTVGQEDAEYLQHRPSRASTEEGPTIQQAETCSPQLSQFYVCLIDYPFGKPHSLSDPPLHQGVLQTARAEASDDGRVRGRTDSDPAAAPGGRSDCPGRHGL